MRGYSPRKGSRRELTATLILSQRLIDDPLQRNIFLRGKFSAIVVLRGDVQDAPVHTRQFDAHIAKDGGHIYGLAWEHTALGAIGAHAEGGGLRKNQGHQ